MNDEDFVTYDIAVRLRKAGFDWPCSHYYTKENASDGNVWLTFTPGAPEDFNRENIVRRSLGICSAPTLAPTQKWLREAHGISVEPVCNMVRQWNVNVCEIDKFGEVAWSKIGLDTYEAALSAGIEGALKLIEEGEV